MAKKISTENEKNKRILTEKIKGVPMDGIVQEALPGAFFKVVLECGHIVRAHLSGKMVKNSINVLPGDTVRMESAPYDLTQARIIYRHKAAVKSR